MDANETELTSALAKVSKYYTAIKDTVQLFEALLILVGNALTLAAIKQTRKLREIPTNIFIMSLAVSDGMTGILLPFMIALIILDDRKIWIATACVLRGPYYSSIPISLSTLLAIAVDRYIAVIHPLSYRKVMTTRRAVVISVLIWMTVFIFMVSLTCSYSYRVEEENIRTIAAHDFFPKGIVMWLLQTLILVPLIGNIVLYFSIFIKMRKTSPVGDMAAHQATETANTQTAKRAKIFTKMMALVLGYLILACLPYYILVPMYNINDPNTPTWFIYIFDLAVVFLYSNSFMNPVIYSWKSKSFQEAYLKILKCERFSRFGGSSHREVTTRNNTEITARSNI